MENKIYSFPGHTDNFNPFFHLFSYILNPFCNSTDYKNSIDFNHIFDIGNGLQYVEYMKASYEDIEHKNKCLKQAC